MLTETWGPLATINDESLPSDVLYGRQNRKPTFQLGSHCFQLVSLNDSHEDNGHIILRGINLHNTVRIALRDGCEICKAACRKCIARVHCATNRRAVWIIQIITQHEWDMGQVALNGDWHWGLEGRISREDSNIDHENPGAITASASAACARGCRSWSCYRRECTDVVSSFASSEGC